MKITLFESASLTPSRPTALAQFDALAVGTAFVLRPRPDCDTVDHIRIKVDQSNFIKLDQANPYIGLMRPRSRFEETPHYNLHIVDLVITGQIL